MHDATVPRHESEALVQVICAGICNTDLEIVKGYARFRGILGHEFVGRVVESPDGSLVGRRVAGEINAGCGSCDLCHKGDPRHCAQRTVLGIHGRDGAFADFLSLPARNLITLPDSINDDQAVFVEPLAAAFNVLEEITDIQESEVAVIGDGKLAQLIVVVLAQFGCAVTVIGKHQSKLELSRSLGARNVADASTAATDFKGRFDVAIEASGSPSGIAIALSVVRPRGTVVLKSTHHSETPLELSQVVVNELRMVGSRCGRFQPAIELLASGRVDLTQLISDHLPLEDGLFAFKLASDPDKMKVILQINA